MEANKGVGLEGHFCKFLCKPANPKAGGKGESNPEIHNLQTYNPANLQPVRMGHSSNYSIDTHFNRKY
jgi:hypothetical protein